MADLNRGSALATSGLLSERAWQQLPLAFKTRRTAVVVLVAATAFFILLRLFWFGYQGSDDIIYWHAAGSWLIRFPYIGADHRALRLPLILPLAVARSSLGDNQAAMVVPTLIYAVGLISLLVCWLSDRAGLFGAAAGAALVVTNVELVLGASSANVDIPEAFFVFLSLRLFDHGATKNSLRTLFLGGVSLGIAALCRETSLFAAIALGVLFLAGFAMPRRQYVVWASGTAFVKIAELSFYWVNSGDFLYRFRIDANHDLTIERWMNQGAGVPLIHPAIDPVTMLFLNHNFGFLAWIGLPLAVWLLRRQDNNLVNRLDLILMTAVGLVWTFLSASLWHELTLIPRYFFLPSLTLSFIAALALDRLWNENKRKPALSFLALLVIGNLAGLAVDNRNSTFGLHELAALAADTTQIIHTDKETSARARVCSDGVICKTRLARPPQGQAICFTSIPRGTWAPHRPKPGSN